MKVRNPGPMIHRVGGVLFPAGEVVDCDEALARFVVAEMRFEKVAEPIANGDYAKKPAKGQKK